MEQRPYLELPEYEIHAGSGVYTGFNSLDLQEIYLVQKQPAVRAQIARGWGKPIIVRLPGGDLLASQYKNLQFERNPRYPQAAEEAALCLSKDGGFSWSNPRLLGIPGRVTQLSALRDGTLIMATGASLFRSTDEGETWEVCKVNWEVFEERDTVREFDETNGIVELPGGVLVCGCYTSTAPGAARSYLIRSQDGGKTWGDASFVTDASEISYILLPGDKLLGFARVSTKGAGEGGASLAIIESADSGRTWTAPRGIGLGQAQVPGFPIRLKDGRLLLVYGNRQFPFGAQAIASRDLGKTWDTDHPILLAWFSWDNYCGHPRSLVLPDGSIMTGYYARIFKGDDDDQNRDIASHALRWRVPDNWPAPR